jgi:hypothetical protein
MFGNNYPDCISELQNQTNGDVIWEIAVTNINFEMRIIGNRMYNTGIATTILSVLSIILILQGLANISKK